jgi:hypothetical protein
VLVDWLFPVVAVVPLEAPGVVWELPPATVPTEELALFVSV